VPSIVGIIVPILVIVAINTIIFVIIMKKHCVCLNRSEQKGVVLKSTNSQGSNIKRQTVIMSTCFVNMGITWLFGFMLIFPELDESVRVTFAFFFCVCNSLQGFLIFVVYIVLSKSRRKYFRFAAAEKFRKLKNTVASSRDLFDVSSSARESKITYTETLK
jgi:hypothetical protein